MGIYDSAYWFSWFTWEGILTLLSSLFIVVFGIMFQFDFFLKNSFAIVFLVFFLFQINMVTPFYVTKLVYFLCLVHFGKAYVSYFNFGSQLGVAFLFSTFINKASSATSVGFFIYIIGFLTQVGFLSIDHQLKKCLHD